MTVSSFLPFANMLADRARQTVMPYFGQRLEMERKSDESPVTRADREAELAMRALIEAEHADHGIFGEEFGEKPANSPFTWVLDPIDGTKSFITGRPLFGTLIALLNDGQPMLGVADMCALGRRWSAVAGESAFCDGEACTTSGLGALTDARLATTSPDMFVGADGDVFARLREQVWFASYGGDLYVYLMLASGHIDVVVEAQLEPYDILALVPIIEGAGGVVTDWQGRPLNLTSDGHVVAAASASLHQAALAALA
jgi:inositol-phosphate phosphatase/L-galactose 1-phosphate phosphatase/histidinol-phosphatase